MYLVFFGKGPVTELSDGAGGRIHTQGVHGCWRKRRSREFYSKGRRRDSKCKRSSWKPQTKKTTRKKTASLGPPVHPKIDARISADIKQLDFLLDLIAGPLWKRFDRTRTRKEPKIDSGSKPSQFRIIDMKTRPSCGEVVALSYARHSTDNQWHRHAKTNSANSSGARTWRAEKSIAFPLGKSDWNISSRTRPFPV